MAMLVVLLQQQTEDLEEVRVPRSPRRLSAIYLLFKRLYVMGLSGALSHDNLFI